MALPLDNPRAKNNELITPQTKEYNDLRENKSAILERRFPFRQNRDPSAKTSRYIRIFSQAAFSISLTISSACFAIEPPDLMDELQADNLPDIANSGNRSNVHSHTFFGESCTLSETTPGKGSQNRPYKSEIICGDELNGFVIKQGDQYRPFGMKASLDEAIENISNLISLDHGGSCEGSTDLNLGDQPTRVLICQNLTDRSPTLALVVGNGVNFQVAYGSASAFPFLANILQIEISSISAPELMKLVSDLWPTPAPLASLSDRRLVASKWSAARDASERLDYAAAQTHLEAALELQLRLYGEEHFTTAAILIDLAMVLGYQESFEAGYALMRRAEPIIDGSSSPTASARLAGYRATLASLQGDLSSASRFAGDATAKWRQIVGSDDQQMLLSLFQSDGQQSIDAQPELALSLAREAALLLKRDDAVSAYAKASEALLTLNSAQEKPPVWHSEILAVLGETSSALGRLSAAQTYFTKAISIRKTHQGDGAGTVRLLIAQGRAYQREAMNVNAIISYRRAIEIARELPRGSNVLQTDDLIPFARAVLSEADILEDPGQKTGLMAELYDAFQIAFVPGRDEVVDLASVHISDTDPALAELANSLKQTLLGQSELRGKLAIERERLANERDYNLVDNLTQRLEQEQNRSNALRNNLLKQSPEYERLIYNRPPDLGLVRSLLAPEEALATFLIGQDSSFVQIVTRENIYIEPIDAGRDELARIVRGLRRGLEIEGRSVNEFPLEDAHFLYKTLFGAVAEPLSDINRLIVVPTGPLSNIPFGTLVASPPVGKDYRKADWLVSRMAITHAPSVTSFVNLRKTTPAEALSKSFLGIANPRFNAPRTALLEETGESCNPEGIALPGRFDSLDQLPDTIDEVSSVIASLGITDADLFADREAKESVFRSRSLNQYNVIYIATHAVMPGEVACQREPGIALARPSDLSASRDQDGFLDASEVAALQIAANLVVLSACNTATSGNSAVHKGDALSGLAESFFIAGARSLLVTHWQVPSGATSSLMRNMFDAVGKDRGLATDSALQRAQISAINDRATAHPFFWGAFSFVGSGKETVFFKERAQ